MGATVASHPPMRVVFTGTGLPSEQVRKGLSLQGWEWVHVPMFRLAPCIPPDVSAQLAWATWVIVTSQETVRLLGPFWSQATHTRMMAVGPVTSQAMGSWGYSVPYPTNGTYSYESVMESLPESLAGERILVPGSAWSDSHADQRLRDRGATVRRCVVYQPHPTGLSLPRLTSLDVVVVSSPAQAKGVGKVSARLIAIGDKAQASLGARAWAVRVGDEAGLLSRLYDLRDGVV